MTTTATPVAPQPALTMRTHIAYLAEDQITRPVGVRVVEPPPDTRQALRGNLYAVVELPVEGAEDEAFVERLLSAIQRTYYTVKGTQSHVLREALREARRALELHSQENDSEPLRAAIVITAVLGRRVLTISNGLGLALTTDGANVDVYPPYTPSAPAQEAVEPEGGWEIYRKELYGGGALFIGGRRWLEVLSLRELASTVAYLTAENSADAAAALLDLANQPELPGLLVVLQPADALPQSSSGVAVGGLPPALRRGRFSGLPISLNAMPPVHTIPAVTGGAKPGAPVKLPVQAAETTHAETAPAGSEAAREEELGTATSLARATAATMALFRTGLARTRLFLGNLFPDQATVATRHGAGDEATGSSAEWAHAADTAPLAEQARPAPPRLAADTAPTLAAPPRTQGSRARLFVLLAVLILVLVPVIVGARQWQQGASNRADAEALLDLAAARLASAQEAYDAGDKVGARSLLAEAQGHVDRARTILVGRSPRADDLAVEIQRELNEVLQIQPLYGLVQPLVRFPSDAQPHRVLVVDQDIYVLDTARQLVQHFRLDLNTNTVPDQTGDIVLRQGDRIGDAEVGRLVAMTWQLPIPGIEDKANLLVLDRNNNLFKYDPRVEGVTQLEMADANAWVAPSHVYAYSGRIYLLDQGANQIFRYNPANYAQPPEGWFAPQTPVNLNGVQAMAIDGDIWLLFANGQIVRYRQGTQISFVLESVIPSPSEPVDMVMGAQADSFIYLADRNEQRVLVFSKDGVFQRQLQAAEGEPLRGLSGLFVDEVAGTMYILTEAALYQHALPN